MTTSSSLRFDVRKACGKVDLGSNSDRGRGAPSLGTAFLLCKVGIVITTSQG